MKMNPSKNQISSALRASVQQSEQAQQQAETALEQAQLQRLARGHALGRVRRGLRRPQGERRDLLRVARTHGWRQGRLWPG